FVEENTSRGSRTNVLRGARARAPRGADRRASRFGVRATAEDTSHSADCNHIAKSSCGRRFEHDGGCVSGQAGACNAIRGRKEGAIPGTRDSPMVPCAQSPLSSPTYGVEFDAELCTPIDAPPSRGVID